MNISDESLGVGLLVGLLLWALSGTGEGGLIVEAVEVAASFLELLDPFLGLVSRCKLHVVYSHSEGQFLPLQSSYDNQRCHGHGPLWADRRVLE